MMKMTKVEQIEKVLDDQKLLEKQYIKTNSKLEPKKQIKSFYKLLV